MTGGAAVLALREAGLTVAAAESLTGGQVCAALSATPGSSTVFVGGVVTYTVGAKERMLGISPSLLAEAGPVDPRVAAQMARGVVLLTGADLAVATTGVAGPDPHGGHEPGFAYVAWSAPGGSGVVEVQVPGTRETVRTSVTDLALAIVTQCARSGCVDLDQLPVRAKRADRE